MLLAIMVACAVLGLLVHAVRIIAGAAFVVCLLILVFAGDRAQRPAAGGDSRRVTQSRKQPRPYRDFGRNSWGNLMIRKTAADLRRGAGRAAPRSPAVRPGRALPAADRGPAGEAQV